SLCLPVRDVGKPRHVGVATWRGLTTPLAAYAFLVLPVGRHAVLGPTIHLFGSNLNLDRSTFWSNHRSVKRLIQVELGRSDVVLETPRNRCPPGVNRAQHCVAVTDSTHQHPESHQVVDLVKLATAKNHLLIDGVVLLGAP